VTGADSAAALAALNSQAAALCGQLTRQSSTSNNTLVIANALWTKDVTLKPAYAGSMKALFEVRRVVPLCLTHNRITGVTGTQGVAQQSGRSTVLSAHPA
jgi:hypothetical protein